MQDGFVADGAVLETRGISMRCSERSTASSCICGTQSTRPTFRTSRTQFGANFRRLFLRSEDRLRQTEEI